MMINFKKNTGFTLVELLVVIAVISLVMSVLFPNFMGMRERARDTQRKSDLAQIQKSMELYKMDQNPQSYPTAGAMPGSLCGQCWSSLADCTGNVYMRKVPCDPGSPSTPTPYIYAANATDGLKYNLSACLENRADENRDASSVAGCSETETSYTVNEP